MAAKSEIALLALMRARSGASRDNCEKALRAAKGNVAKALNALAAGGHRRGRPPYDDKAPLGSYEFDAYARRLCEVGSNRVQEHLPKGKKITAIVLHAQSTIPVSLINAFTDRGGARSEGAAVQIQVDEERGAIPLSPGEDDWLLETFRYRFGFQDTRPDVGLLDDADPALAWVVGSLPEVVYDYEMIACAHAIGARLEQAGHPLAADFEGAYARHDLLLRDRKSHLQTIRKRLRSHLSTDKARRAFASLCYASPEKRKWLVSLTR